MKNTLFIILIALIIGFFLGSFFIKKYNGDLNLVIADSTSEVYFIQYGIFSDFDSMEKNTINLENYIYKEDMNKYYVYVGITKNKDNCSKIQNFYSKLGYNTIVKSYFINNNKFLKLLNDYDEIISKIEDDTVLSSVMSQVLSKYEEVVIRSGKN